MRGPEVEGAEPCFGIPQPASGWNVFRAHAIMLVEELNTMPITASDFMEMVSLIEQHPEWRAELRRLVLTEDLLALPRIVVELGEAQKRTEQGILELVKAQQDTEHRIT